MGGSTVPLTSWTEEFRVSRLLSRMDVEGVKEKIGKLEKDIRDVKNEIKGVQKKIDEVQEKLKHAKNVVNVTYFQGKVVALLNEKATLRIEAENLRSEKALWLKPLVEHETNKPVRKSDRSRHWSSVMLPGEVPALPGNANDLRDILFPREFGKLPVTEEVYESYLQTNPEEAGEYLVKADGSRFCVVVSYMLAPRLPPDSEIDVTVACGGAAIKGFFRAFDEASPHAFRPTVLLNQAEFSTISDSKADATKKKTRPDTIVIASDCTFLVGEDKRDRLKDAEVDLQRMLMPLSQVFYGEVSFILGYEAVGTNFQWVYVGSEKGLERISPVLGLSSNLGNRCKFLLSIGHAYMLIKKMSETVPDIPGRRAMFTVEEKTGKTRLLEWFHDNVLKKIKDFDEHCVVCDGSSLETIREAYEVAEPCKYLPTATEGPSVEDGTFSVRIRPLGCPVLLRDVEEAKTFTRHVCRALSALHDVGLVHRDVRLPNIVKVFETHQHPEYYFMLIDLETVSRADHKVPSGFCSFRFWTPDTLEASHYTPRSDLYHLGLILRMQMRQFEHSDAVSVALAFVKDLLAKKLDAQDALCHPWLQQ